MYREDTENGVSFLLSHCMTFVESPNLSATGTVCSSVSGGEEGRVRLTKSFMYFFLQPPTSQFCFFMLIAASPHGEWKMV